MTAPAEMPGVGQIIEPDDYGEYLRKERTHTRYGYMQWQRAKAANRRADQAEARASEAEARALAAEAALAAAEDVLCNLMNAAGHYKSTRSEDDRAALTATIKAAADYFDAAALRAQGE